MTSTDRLRLLVSLILGALALSMLLCSVVHAEPTTLADRIAAIVPSLASKSEPAVDASELAEAIVSVPKITPEWAALLLTIATHESALSARIAAGRCRPHECDSGRAWGLWQNWKSASNAEAWGSPDLKVQAIAASRLVRQYHNMCRGSGVSAPLSVFRALSGRGCNAKLRDEDARMRTFRSVRARLQ